MHFVFAPNPRSSRAARFVVRTRRVPSIHTVASAPRTFDPRLLFATVTVVLSHETERRFLEAGVPRERLERVPAPIRPVPSIAREDARRRLGLPERDPVLLFPGDLEPGGGSDEVVSLAKSLSIPKFTVAMACRHKTSESPHIEQRLRERLGDLPAGRDVRWFGETHHIHELLAASDVTLLPASSLVAKTDHPLVLLESLLHRTPVVVSDAPTLAELVESGGALAADRSGAGLVREVEALLSNEARRRSMGERGRSYVERNHGVEPVATRYEALYERVVDDSERVRP